MLLAAPFRQGKLGEYKKFIAEITGPRKKESSDLLKRYRRSCTKVWVQKIDNQEYAMIFHEATEEAAEQLENCYEGAFIEGHLLFSFEIIS